MQQEFHKEGKGKKKYLKKTIAENFMKKINVQIQESQQTSSNINLKIITSGLIIEEVPSEYEFCNSC